MSTVRKNLSLSIEAEKILSNFSQKFGISQTEVVENLLFYLKKKERQLLREYPKLTERLIWGALRNEIETKPTIQSNLSEFDKLKAEGYYER
jgi:hypothetical protein